MIYVTDDMNGKSDDNLPFSCMIRSIQALYPKKYLTWTDGSCTALLRNGILILSGKMNDPDEWKEFILNYTGTESVYTDGDAAAELRLKTIQTGLIMGRKVSGNSLILPSLAENLDEIWKFFCDSGMPSAREPFLLEVSHSIRHGHGVSVVKRDNEGKIAAAAVSYHITDNAAVIAAVAVRENLRRCGLGLEIMDNMAEKLAGRKLFLFRENLKNSEFYKAAGYKNCGIWTIGGI